MTYISNINASEIKAKQNISLTAPWRAFIKPELLGRAFAMQLHLPATSSLPPNSLLIPVSQQKVPFEEPAPNLLREGFRRDVIIGQVQSHNYTFQQLNN